MKPRIPKPLSICAGCLLGAAGLALLQSEEYAISLESINPHWRKAAQMLREAGQISHFSKFTSMQKDVFARALDLPEMANSLPDVEENSCIPESSNDEPQPRLVDDITPKQPARPRPPLFPQQEAELPHVVLDENHVTGLVLEMYPDLEASQISISIAPEDFSETQEEAPETDAPVAATEPAEATDTQSPIEEPKEEPIADNTLAHCRIMMVGDSLMESLGPTIHRKLRNRKELHFILTAKYSTGLCRADYFNWPARMEEAILETRPDIILFFIGANDANVIIEEDKSGQIPFRSGKWRDVYSLKVQQMAEIAKRHNCRIIWIGLPPFGGKIAKKLIEPSLIQREVCERIGITFINSHQSLADENGEYRTYMKNAAGKNIRLRHADMCHLTDAGNNLLFAQLLPTLEETIKDFNRNNPDRKLSEEELARVGYAPLQVVFKYSPKRPTRRKKR